VTSHRTGPYNANLAGFDFCCRPCVNHQQVAPNRLKYDQPTFLVFGRNHTSPMQDECSEDAAKEISLAIYNATNTAAAIDDPDLAWSESEDEEIGDDFDSEDEREMDTQDGGADDEDWELAERGAAPKHERTMHFCH
jgi:hypothetical protein